MARFRFDVANASVEAYERLMLEVDGFYNQRAVVHFKGVPLTVSKEGFMTISLDLGADSLEIAIDGTTGYLTAFREGGAEADQDPEWPWYHFGDQPATGLGGGRKRKLANESSYSSLIREDWYV